MTTVPIECTCWRRQEYILVRTVPVAGSRPIAATAPSDNAILARRLDYLAQCNRHGRVPATCDLCSTKGQR